MEFMEWGVVLGWRGELEGEGRKDGWISLGVET